MNYFRESEEFNELSIEDRLEIFTTVLLGSSDVTKVNLDLVIKEYNAGSNLFIVDLNDKKQVAYSIKYLFNFLKSCE